VQVGAADPVWGIRQVALDDAAVEQADAELVLVERFQLAGQQLRQDAGIAAEAHGIELADGAAGDSPFGGGVLERLFDHPI
jgi:hypothetical protein